MGTKHVGITELPQIKYKKAKQISSLREKCPSTEFFLVQIQENTDQKKLRTQIHFSHSACFRDDLLMQVSTKNP